MNDLQIIATYKDAHGNTKHSAKKLTLFYDPGKPEISVYLPRQDVATKQSNSTLNATDGTAVKLFATFNGATREVTPDNPFGITLTTEGVNAVKMLSSDSNGVSSEMVRNVIYDITPPDLGRPDISGGFAVLSGSIEAGAKLEALDPATLLPLPSSLTKMTYVLGLWLYSGRNTAKKYVCSQWATFPLNSVAALT